MKNTKVLQVVSRCKSHSSCDGDWLSQIYSLTGLSPARHRALFRDTLAVCTANIRLTKSSVQLYERLYPRYVNKCVGEVTFRRARPLKFPFPIVEKAIVTKSAAMQLISRGGTRTRNFPRLRKPFQRILLPGDFVPVPPSSPANAVLRVRPSALYLPWMWSNMVGGD